MSERLPPHFLELVYDAALKSFWTKKGLKRFLRRSHIAESFLAQLSETESKRDWLDRLFPKLEGTDKGQRVIREMATTLAEQTAFPDLDKWENSKAMVEDAKLAVGRLRDYLEKKKAEQQKAAAVRKSREDAEKVREVIRRSTIDLAKLRERLEGMTNQIGTQAGGYAFQDWFYDMMSFFEVENRKPYIAPDNRQVDGSITIEGTTYLVELKFTAGQAGVTDIDSLLAKVNTKSDNTMGLMVSMSGYDGGAVKQASFAKSPLLLLDHNHLYAVLLGSMEFGDVVRRVRRHSSQTGEAFLPPSSFGGR